MGIPKISGGPMFVPDKTKKTVLIETVFQFFQ